MNKRHDTRELLLSRGLKITPQRMVVLGALLELRSHPTADDIINHIRLENPNIAVGTIYRILDTLVDNSIIERVKTSNDVMRYDAITERHHHLYCNDSDRIVDYYDDELDKLIDDYLSRTEIDGFRIEDFRIQIIGSYPGKHNGID